MSKRIKITLVTIIILAVAACTGVGFAFWAGEMNPEFEVTLKAGSVVELTFGSNADIAVEGAVSPGGSINGAAIIKSSSENLSVKYAIKSVEVKLDGETQFKDATSQNFFTLTTPKDDGTVSIDPKRVEFVFTMRDNVSTAYVKAEFRVTVKATGQKAAQ